MFTKEPHKLPVKTKLYHTYHNYMIIKTYLRKMMNKH